MDDKSRNKLLFNLVHCLQKYLVLKMMDEKTKMDKNDSEILKNFKRTKKPFPLHLYEKLGSDQY